MAQNTSVSFIKVKSKATVHLLGSMALSTQDCSETDKYTGVEFTPGVTVKNTKEIGK